MPGFNWTSGRLNRLRAAVRAFNAAITRRTRELVDAGLQNLVQYLPDRANVQEVQSRVHNVNDFRRIVGYRNDLKHGRTSELTRILRTAKRDALDFTEDSKGNVVTNYAEREYRNNRMAIRKAAERTRRDMASELFEGDTEVDLDALTPPELGALTSDTNMLDDGEEGDDSFADVDAGTLRRWKEEDSRKQRSQVQPDAMYEVWLSVWTNRLNFHDMLPGYQDVVDAMTWLARHRPDVLNKMFASGRDELEPAFITESGGNRNPYVNIPYETRHNRVVDYVTRMASNAGWQNDIAEREQFFADVDMYSGR